MSWVEWLIASVTAATLIFLGAALVHDHKINTAMFDKCKIEFEQKQIGYECNLWMAKKSKSFLESEGAK